MDEVIRDSRWICGLHHFDRLHRTVAPELIQDHLACRDAGLLLRAWLHAANELDRCRPQNADQLLEVGHECP